MAGLVAWSTGRPFIFPSLGPTAYVLAFDLVPNRTHSARAVIGGHICGMLGGLASYHVLVGPRNLMSLTESFSHTGFLLTCGAVVALAITTFLMLLLNASHPPACATTLIVSLGIMPEIADGLYIVGAVAIMYGCYILIQKRLVAILQKK